MTPAKGADQETAPRFSVRLAVVVLALIIIAPLAISGAVNLHQFRKAYRSKVANELSVMIERHSLTVDSFIDDRLSDVRVIAREHPIERLRQPAFLRLVLNIMREEYHGAFVDLGLVSSDGIQVAYAGPFNLHMADYSAAPLVPRSHGQRKLLSAMYLPVCAVRPTSSLPPSGRSATRFSWSRQPSTSRPSTPWSRICASAAPASPSSSTGTAISKPARASRWRSTGRRTWTSWKAGSERIGSSYSRARMSSGNGQSSPSHRSNRASGSCVINKRLRTPSPSFDASRSLRSSY